MNKMYLSNKVGMGNAYIFNTDECFANINIDFSIDEEKKKLQISIKHVKQENFDMIDMIKNDVDEDLLLIFEHFNLILDDVEFLGKIETYINNGLYASDALDKVLEEYVVLFDKIDNDYLKDRKNDFYEIVKRLKKNLKPCVISDYPDFFIDTILICDTLYPTMVAKLDTTMVKGIVVKKISETSHSVILAKSLGIPTVINYNDMDCINNDDSVVIDSVNNSIYINVDDEEKQKYKTIIREQSEIFNDSDVSVVVTSDYSMMNIFANISSSFDLNFVKNKVFKGIGLYRTEFLFMKYAFFPDEETQFLIYKDIVQISKDKPVCMRLLDIGGDKELPYYSTNDRGVEFLLKNKRILTNQIKAILRASAFGNLSIMVPMIKTREQFLKVKDVFIEVKNLFLEKNIDYDGSVQFGMMLETKDAFESIEDFTPIADFFSIGSNDLCESYFNVSRYDTKVNFRYLYLDPSFIKVLSSVKKICDKKNIPLSVCGEMASSKYGIIVLVGLSIYNLSINPLKIKDVQRRVGRNSVINCENFVRSALRLNSKELVLEFLNNETSLK